MQFTPILIILARQKNTIMEAKSMHNWLKKLTFKWWSHVNIVQTWVYFWWIWNTIQMHWQRLQTQLRDPIARLTRAVFLFRVAHLRLLCHVFQRLLVIFIHLLAICVLDLTPHLHLQIRYVILSHVHQSSDQLFRVHHPCVHRRYVYPHRRVLKNKYI